MKNCHVCNFKCEDNAEICPVCGADLTHLPKESEQGAAPVLLARFEDVVSAEIFKDILADNEIPYSMGKNNDVGVRVSFGGIFTADEIYVDRANFEKAQALYEEFLSSDAAAGEFIFDDEFEEE